jgi:glutamine---fructose-6-phosphate transaminase (isomerizing)
MRNKRPADRVPPHNKDILMTTLLEQEIASQPNVIAELLDRETQRVRTIAAQLPPFEYAQIAARGTSDHAAIYATYIWAALTGHSVALATPSLHTLYHRPPRVDNALVVGVSQSGQSPDIVAVLEEGRRQGRPTLAITNDGNSPLAAAADHVIELHAGAERSVAATKTYTAQLVVMALLAAAWSGEPERFTELAQLPQALAGTLAGATALQPIAERYHTAEHIVVIGRGYNYATALELALKLKELTYIMTNAYSSADFRHGPIATISEGVPVVLVMPEGAVMPDLVELANDLKSRGAELLIVSNSPTVNSLTNALLPFSNTLPEWLSPIAAIVPGQSLALHLALARGSNPDRPRGLQKVTLTR